MKTKTKKPQEVIPSKKWLAKGFNEWMRRYEKEPERFANEYELVKQYLSEKRRGKPLTYGQIAAEYLSDMMFE